MPSSVMPPGNTELCYFRNEVSNHFREGKYAVKLFHSLLLMPVTIWP